MINLADQGLSMMRTGSRRRLAIGLIPALLVNAALLALMARGERDVVWHIGADTGVSLRLELTREPQRPVATAPERSRDGQEAKPAQLSPHSSKQPLAQARAPATPVPGGHGGPAALPTPPLAQGAKAGGRQVESSGAADLQAKTALALRKLGACSRVNSGTGDAQDRAICTANFTAANGPGLDSIAADKRAEYDAAHAKAGYLVPSDAANPDFVTSRFKRGGTVVTGHAGCSLVEGAWRCVGH